MVTTTMALTVFECSRRLIVLPVSRFHSRIVPSSCPEMHTCERPSANAMAESSERSSVSTRRQPMSYGSHMRIVLSSEAVNIRSSAASGPGPPPTMRTARSGPWWPPGTTLYSTSRSMRYTCTRSPAVTAICRPSSRKMTDRSDSVTSRFVSTIDSACMSYTNRYPYSSTKNTCRCSESNAKPVKLHKFSFCRTSTHEPVLALYARSLLSYASVRTSDSSARKRTREMPLSGNLRNARVGPVPVGTQSNSRSPSGPSPRCGRNTATAPEPSAAYSAPRSPTLCVIANDSASTHPSNVASVCLSSNHGYSVTCRPSEIFHTRTVQSVLELRS
mmetsp:Transcript_4611/g.15905  ORF Transcript_4611/g.15905 Transcript_4611/m.15905 type:complete len:331 (-) Transcript_4611:527-1519(-)